MYKTTLKTIAKYSVTLALIVGCAPKEKEIDRLICCDGDFGNHQSILFLMESGYVPPLLDSASLSRYLFPTEFAGAFDSVELIDHTTLDTTWSRRFKYGHVGTLYDTLGFTAELLLIDSLPCLNRDYRFQIRTYDHNSRVIDTLTYAMWSQCLMKWCSGIAFENMQVEREWDNGPKEAFRISNEGEFVRL